MSKAADRGNPSGTPQSGQPTTGTPEGASGASDPKGQSDKKILGRFNTQADLEKAYKELEDRDGKNSATLQEAKRLVQSLRGMSDFVERDPVSGEIKFKKEIADKLSGSGEKSPGYDRDAIKATLTKQFNEGLASGDPAGAFIDTVIRAAEQIAESKAQGVRTEVGGRVAEVQGQTELDRYLRENPHMESLVPHVGEFLRGVPASARSRMQLGDAFEVIREKLKRTGELEGTGYREPSSDNRRGPGLTGGAPGSQLSTTSSDEEINRKIKSDILDVKDPLAGFEQPAYVRRRAT